MPFIKTKRTLLRPISPKDCQEVFAYRSDAKTNQYQSWIPKTNEEVKQFISGNPEDFNSPGTWFQLVIEERTSGKIIGDIGIHFMDESNLQCELGCTLHKDFQSKGFALEALSEAIDYLFTQLGKHRILTSIDPENTASIKLMDRLGFRKEGHFKESILINGKWKDEIIYAMLQGEWR